MRGENKNEEDQTINREEYVGKHQRMCAYKGKEYVDIKQSCKIK